MCALILVFIRLSSRGLYIQVKQDLTRNKEVAEEEELCNLLKLNKLL